MPLSSARPRGCAGQRKPARAFFQAAMADMGLERGVMIGDDIEADVGGAMAAGLPGVLVRTGKYRQMPLPHA